MNDAIRVHVERRNGIWIATSPDLPGLFITNQDIGELRRVCSLAAADLLLPNGMPDPSPMRVLPDNSGRGFRLAL